MALVEGLRNEFADHDVYLHLVLGLVSASRRLECLLPEAPAGALPEQSSVPTEEEERWVLALLGLISVRRTLMEQLEPLSAEGMASRASAEGSVPEGPSGVLELLR